MTRVTRRLATRDIPDKGIKRGQEYYIWNLYGKPRQWATTKPRPSQLTNSVFLRDFYSLKEEFDDFLKKLVMDENRITFPESIAYLKRLILGLSLQEENLSDRLSSISDVFKTNTEIKRMKKRRNKLLELSDELGSILSELENMTGFGWNYRLGDQLKRIDWRMP